MMMIKGLMAPTMEEMEVDSIDPEENTKTTEMMIEEWNLGPEDPSEKPGENTPYWSDMARLWQCDEEEARRRMCANCEYFDNTPERIEVMDAVPFNEFDENAGGRGYCHKFDFICHNLRSCQAWERKCYIPEDD